VIKYCYVCGKKGHYGDRCRFRKGYLYQYSTFHNYLLKDLKCLFYQPKSINKTIAINSIGSKLLTSKQASSLILRSIAAKDPVYRPNLKRSFGETKSDPISPFDDLKVSYDCLKLREKCQASMERKMSVPGDTHLSNEE